VPDAAVIQVGQMIVERLAGWPELNHFTVCYNPSTENATSEEAGDTINVYPVDHTFEVALQQWQTLHTPIYEVEIITREPGDGTSLSNAGGNAIAHVVAAIASDRSFGNQLQDVQETDVGGTVANGRDANGMSIQFRAEFYTSRNDWFTIVAP